MLKQGVQPARPLRISTCYLCSGGRRCSRRLTVRDERPPSRHCPGGLCVRRCNCAAADCCAACRADHPFLQVVPSTAIGFTLYDYCKSALALPTNL